MDQLDSRIAVHSTDKHQQHDSGLVPDSSFSESKARCRMGHETQKRGATSSGANSPMILAFLQKGGQRQKYFIFAIFLRNPFLHRA